MSVREGKGGDGSDVIMWSCAQTDEYKWVIEGNRIISHAARVGKLRKGEAAKGGDLCLSVREDKIRDGSDVIAWSCQDGEGQKWIHDGERFRLVNDKAYCLSVPEGLANDGTRMILWSCDVGAHKGADEL